MRRREEGSVHRLVVATTALVFLSSVAVSNGLSISLPRQTFYRKGTRSVTRRAYHPPTESTPSQISERSLHLHAQIADDDTDSWSRPRTESPLGIRRRVKSVLAKAKKRTGINNPSAEETAYSLGLSTGFSKKNGVSKMNGKSQFEINETAVPQRLPMPSAVVQEPARTDVQIEATQIAEPVESKETIPETVNTDSSEKSEEMASAKTEEIVSAPAKTEKIVSEPAKTEEIVYAPPLPFTLPTLTRTQREKLNAGERVQEQSKMGREGSGFVVVDVNAPSDVVWDCLLDFQSYPTTIPTVRDITMYTNTHLSGDIKSEKQLMDGTYATLKHGVPSVTRASFSLSKFRLKIAAVHKYSPHPEGHYMVFTLDPTSRNFVLRNAKGVWHTQENPEGKGEGVTRVWLLCEVAIADVLPKWIVDYAAERAMPRATTWLKPQVEAAATLWLKKDNLTTKRPSSSN